jgi:quinol monooxygenase YgiN
MAEHAQIIRLTRYRPDPGQRDRLLTQLQQLTEAMRSLPGLFGAQICRSQEDPEAVVVISRWENEGALRGLGQPQLATTIQAAAQLAESAESEHLIAG